MNRPSARRRAATSTNTIRRNVRLRLAQHCAVIPLPPPPPPPPRPPPPPPPPPRGGPTTAEHVLRFAFGECGGGGIIAERPLAVRHPPSRRSRWFWLSVARGRSTPLRPRRRGARGFSADCVAGSSPPAAWEAGGTSWRDPARSPATSRSLRTPRPDGRC